MDGCNELKVVGDRKIAVEAGAVGYLGQIPSRDDRCGFLVDRVAPNLCLSAGRFQYAADKLGRDRLFAAVRPHHRNALARAHLRVRPVVFGSTCGTASGTLCPRFCPRFPFTVTTSELHDSWHTARTSTVYRHGQACGSRGDRSPLVACRGGPAGARAAEI